jgi:hypothetical protein
MNIQLPESKNRSKIDFSKAGHYEILGETIAKFEFFENGFNPYSRYLDVDKVDLVLRKKVGDAIRYFEVQIKWGRLYKCGPKWERENFDYTSWRFFNLDDFKLSDPNLFLAYVMADPETGYKGDIFIFPIPFFKSLIQSAIRTNSKKGPKAKMNIAHSPQNNRWYLWRKRNFSELNDDTVVDVTKYRRAFHLIDKK